MNKVTELRQMADRLIELAGDERQDTDSRRNAPNALMRKASYHLEDCIQELLEEGAKTYGKTIIPGTVQVLRERHV